MRIVLGLSGGVDSSAAARLLLDEGHEVIGAYLDIGQSAEPVVTAARELGIRLEIIDIRQQLEDLVCRPFREAYLSGKTPNPCVRCNPLVKFPALLELADRLGAEHVATGHYARVAFEDGAYRLYSAKSGNDQSYMLCMLPQDILSRLILPLGEFEKTETRRIASCAGLSASSRPDSMEICFIPDNDYAAYIERFAGKLPAGDLIDKNGRVIGRHEGIHRYTIGQRRGLGFAAGERVYVGGINVENNTVSLVPEAELLTDRFETQLPHWTVRAPSFPLECQVKVRHSKTMLAAALSPTPTGLSVTLGKAVRRPSPGQTAAFYLGDEVLGGAEIL
ncbi:MAG: tRNA 2-thiouridine(34) synthase MnmA, partial [Oscillospiraceae bacterium]|nr:tRNA 2-thiouridine(34) synthase MnmA [Oscillospiraceae bacterium]